MSSLYKSVPLKFTLTLTLMSDNDIIIYGIIIKFNTAKFAKNEAAESEVRPGLAPYSQSSMRCLCFHPQ